MIRAWQPKLDDQYAMESATNAALELLILMILQELDTVVHQRSLHLSSKTIGPSNIKNFSLEKIKRTF